MKYQYILYTILALLLTGCNTPRKLSHKSSQSWVVSHVAFRGDTGYKTTNVPDVKFDYQKHKYYDSNFKKKFTGTVKSYIIGTDSLLQITPIKDGKVDGIVTSYNRNGSLFGKINWIEGRRHGKYTTYHSNGVPMYEGEWRHGHHKGKVTRYSWYGHPYSVDHYDSIKGKKNGESSSYDYMTGAIEYRSNYKNGKQDGLYTGYNKDGSIRYQAHYKNGNKDGETRSYVKDGTLWSIEHYKKDKKHGLCTDYNYGTRIIQTEAHYRKGKYHGNVKKYNENGVLIESSNYENGVLNGVRQKYHDTGTLRYEYSYVDGEQIGIQCDYYENGNKRSERMYYTGATSDKYYTNDAKEYWPNGCLREVIHYHEGVRRGTQRYYDENGILYKTEQEEGEDNGYYKHGESIIYYPNGKIKSITHYKNQSKHGKMLEYNEKGKLVRKSKYKHNKLVYFDTILKNIEKK